MIGKLQRVRLRDVWEHEALDFTTWLRDNIDVLSEAIDLTLSNPETEQSTLEFKVDIVAEEASGGTVVIENQLEKSDHDHLGKLITYLTALGAKAAVWITSEPRPEHVGAIAWLNESSGASFYLLKVEAVKIGDSSPAPLLTLIVGPSEATREVGETKKEMAERHVLRERFWTGLLEKAKRRTKLHSNISPTTDNWLGASSGTNGLTFMYVVRKQDAQVELYIDRGKELDEENRAILQRLAGSKEDIERNFGGQLEWEQVQGRRMCRIKAAISSGGYGHEERWPEIQDEMIDAMVRLETALRPHVDRLSI